MASYYYTNDPRNQSIPMNPMNTDQRSREASTNTAHGGRHIPGRYNTASGTQSIAPGGNHIPGGNRAVSGSGAGYMPDGNRTASESQNTAHGGRHIPGRYNTASGTQSITPGGNHIPGGYRAASGSGAGYMPAGNRTTSESQNTAHGGRHIPGIYNTANRSHGGNYIPGENLGASGYQGAGVATAQQQLPSNPPVIQQSTGLYGSSYTPNPTGQYNVGAHGGRHIPGSRSQQQPNNYLN